MQRTLISLLSGILILTACQGGSAAESITPLPSATLTVVPASPAPGPTQTITPLPTIPTFTHAPKAECPDVTPISKPDFSFLEIAPAWDIEERSKAIDEMRQRVVTFLNQHGVEPLLDHLNRMSAERGFDTRKVYLYQDVTNDGQPELLFASAIFGCHQKEYKLLLEFAPYVTGGVPSFEQIQDGNRNGLPEIVVNINTGNHGGRWYAIYEWSKQKFRKVLEEFFTNSDGGWKFRDLNGDGVEELIVTEGVNVWPPPLDIPLRNKFTYYQWNGTAYAAYDSEFDKPVYRFQAVQDADRYVQADKFDKALTLYKAVIFDETLDWWSKEKGTYRTEYQMAIFARYIEGTLQPTQIPPTALPKDTTEYPKLSAYAYYRILLLDVMRQQEPDAETTYTTLQQKFGSDPDGRPYVEMATAFWNAYRSTHEMYHGCRAAIQYAIEHPELLVPLGSDYHGQQSHIYTPPDICPVR